MAGGRPAREEEGVLGPDGFSLLRWAGVSCEMYKDRYYNPRVERVSRFGRRWRIVYYLPGDDRPARGSNTNAAPAQAGDAAAAPLMANPVTQVDPTAQLRMAADEAGRAAARAAAEFQALAAQVGVDPRELQDAAARARDATAEMDRTVNLLERAVTPRPERQAVPGGWAIFLSWFFGGTRLRETPAQKLGRVLDTIQFWP